MHSLKERILAAYTKFQDEGEMDADGSVNEVYVNAAGISVMESCANGVGDMLGYADFVTKSKVASESENFGDIDRALFPYQGFEAVIKTKVRNSEQIHELNSYESTILNFRTRVCRFYNDIWFCVFKIEHDDYSSDKHWLELRMHFILAPANAN